MKALFFLTTLFSLALATSNCLSAQASTLPISDFTHLRLGLGSGPGLSVQVPVLENLSLGGSFAQPLIYGNFGFTRYDAHLNFRLLQNETLSVSAILGVFGDVNTSQREGLKLSPFGIEAGVAIAYRINELFTARVNIVPGLAFPNSTGWGLFPPAGGIEVAYHPFPHLEFTAGFNGNVDILGCNYTF
jgi:hypothetical protein